MQRTAYFDLLNVFSCISVIALHCNGYVHSYAMDAEWHAALVFEVLFYFAVPVFIMLSGATLFDYRERYDTRTFYTKRIQRTVLPWFVWSIVIGFAYLMAANHIGKEVETSVSVWVQNFIEGKIPLTAYWFFMPLFMLYLFTPWLSKVVRQSSCKQLLWLCGIIVFFQAIVSPIFILCNIDYQFSLPISGNFALYAIMGYALSKYPLEENRRFFSAVAILALFSLIVRYVGICNAGERSPLFMTYSGLFAVLPAIMVFMIGKKLDSHLSLRVRNILRELSKLSLGVYLIHMVVLRTFCAPFGDSSAIVRYAGIPIVYLVSIGLVWLMKKLPLVKAIVP